MSLFRICPICGKKPTAKFFGMSSYWFCESCEIAWKKRFPKADYDETYYKGKSSFAGKLFAPIANMFYSIRQSFAGSEKQNIWIDVGAGEGGFLKTVNSKDRIGVEVSSSGREMMESVGLKTLSDVQFLKVKDLKADVISFWHVLEHVDNPWNYLEAAKKNLKKNGKIIIGIPNFKSFEFYLSKKYWFHLQPQFHLWHFSPNSFKKVLEQAGFSVKHIDYWSVEHHPTGVLQSFINKSSKSTENVLHKLIKRGTGKSRLKAKDIFWSFFWMSLGSPIIFIFWVLGALLHRSGTIIIVATPSGSVR